MDLDQIVALPEAWVLMLAPLIPVLTAALTKWREPGRRGAQAVVAIVLSAVLTAAAVLFDAAPDTLGGVAGTFLLTFTTQLASYLGLWQNVGESDDITVVDDATNTVRPARGINAVLAPRQGV